MPDRIIPVILSGGSGTRLWPLSKPTRPKQFLSLVGERTMLQLAAQRVDDPNRFRKPWVIAGDAQADTVTSQLSDIGLAAEKMILEPCGRNTAAAIALAALAAEPDDLLLIMPSDHLIAEPDAFIAAVASARAAAEEGWLITFGIEALYAETGYGYIKLGAEIAHGVFESGGFLEKPDVARATELVSEGSYFWNAGIFLFRAGSLLAELREYQPEIVAIVERALGPEPRRQAELRPDLHIFSAVPPLSIDHGVMERSKRVAVVPVSMGWSDIGSWDALYAVGSRDVSGNILQGNVDAVESQGCLLRSEGPRIVAAGVQDLIVVATADEVLILPRGRGQLTRAAAEAALSSPGGGLKDAPPG